MYSILEHYLSTNHILMIGMIVTFILTFFLLEHPFSFLPSDQGRAFAVNGSLSKGKLRGVGFIFVLCFLISSVLFLPIDVEYVIYAILLFAMMISGYLDDASKTPWNEYKKGLIDLVISVVAVLTYMNFNSTTICFGADEIVIPKALFLILGVILIWVSVNVTNCTDGVDGLCASLCSVTLLAFGVLFASVLQKYAMANFLFLSVLFAYLYFNSSPSSMLMGDAGSRALGFYIAVIALKSTHPFIYILLAAVMIVDGGIGLVKIALKRFLKISILKKTRTPLHDHVRKNLGWSDTQVVVRFLILQTVLAAVAYCLIHYVEVAQRTQVQVVSERLRSSILSALSHDLRTPLTALVGLADSLTVSRPPLADVARETAEAIREQAERLAGLVGNLLDMARLHAGEITLRKEWQPIEEVIGSSIKLLGRALAEHPVKVLLAGDFPLLEFDAVLIERVLCNLLENAAKYSPPGSPIEIAVRLREHRAEVAVSDGGKGFAEDASGALFEMFVRGEHESSTPGVGLGLAICRAIVDAHGGTIAAANRAPGGACVSFTLPLGEPPLVEEEVVAGDDRCPS